MSDKEIVDTVIEHLKREFEGESTGHDWFHIERVWKNARLIWKTEGGNLLLIELAALLHDIADHKFVENADAVADERIETILKPLGVTNDIIEQVKEIVRHASFKGGIKNTMTLREGLIIQDADRLDAIGAIGIARTFAFGGKFGNVLYDPSVKPKEFKTAEEYRKGRTHTINHFYEKLLLLKEGMNTQTGKKLAEKRHTYMEGFLRQFYDEWNGLI